MVSMIIKSAPELSPKTERALMTSNFEAFINNDVRYITELEHRTSRILYRIFILFFLGFLVVN
jgi:hypothetical protein